MEVAPQEAPQAVVSEGDFLSLHHEEGSVRDASVIESRFMGSYIAERDVEHLRLSFLSDQLWRMTVYTISNIMKESWHMDAGTLQTIEEAWAGVSKRVGPEYIRSTPLMCVRFALRMFVASGWQPVRELVCLAVSNGAMTMMSEHASLRILPGVSVGDSPLCTAEQMTNVLRILQSQSIVDILTAAISMQTLSST
jgi:hypothetical protein